MINIVEDIQGIIDGKVQWRIEIDPFEITILFSPNDDEELWIPITYTCLEEEGYLNFNRLNKYEEEYDNKVITEIDPGLFKDDMDIALRLINYFNDNKEEINNFMNCFDKKIISEVDNNL